MTFRLLTADDFPALWEILSEAFPETERRTEEKQKALFGNAHYRVCGVEEEGLEAVFAYWDFGDFYFGEHLASRPQTRGKGIGAKLFTHVASLAKGRIWFEVEPPENDLATRRIGFYLRNGCNLTDFDYIQPSMQEGQPPIPLRIMATFPMTEEEFQPMKRTVFQAVYHKNL